MDPVTLILVPGILGGIVVALIVFRLQAPPPGVDPLRKHPVSTDVINMARIRVDGIGGLGLVAMALAVAWFVLRIRQHIAIGLALGVLFAVVLIVLRRPQGIVRSSSDDPGANTTLSLGDAPRRSGRGSDDVTAANVRSVTA